MELRRKLTVVAAPAAIVFGLILGDALGAMPVHDKFTEVNCGPPRHPPCEWVKKHDGTP